MHFNAIDDIVFLRSFVLTVGKIKKDCCVSEKSMTYMSVLKIWPVSGN